MEMQEIERLKAFVNQERKALARDMTRMEKENAAANDKEREFDARCTYGQRLLDYLHDPDSLHLFSDAHSGDRVGEGAGRDDRVPTAAATWTKTTRALALDEFWLFRIEALTFEEKAPRREAMENILGTFRGMDGISFIYLILGDGDGAKFYFGVAKDHSYAGDQLSAHTLGEDMLGPAIRGNFRGCAIEEVSPEGKKAIIERLRPVPRAEEVAPKGKKAMPETPQPKPLAVGILEGVPGTDEENESFQGVDRLVDVMARDAFGFLLIARPYTEKEIAALEGALFSLADALSPLAHRSLQISTSASKNESQTRNATEGFGLAENASVSHTNNDTDAHDTRNDKSNQQQENMTESAGTQYSTSQSFNKSQGNPPSETASDSGVESGSVQKQGSYTVGHTLSEGQTVSHSHTEGDSFSETQSGNRSVNVGKSMGESVAENVVSTRQTELYAKEAADWLRYIDEVLLKRLDYGRGKGVFLSCGYLFAKHKATLQRLANTAISLYSGPKGNKAALRFHVLPVDSPPIKALSNMQIPAAVRNPEENTAWSAGLSRLESGHASFAGHWFSAHELSVLTALPQKEIPGLALREEVAFGMNIPPVKAEKRIRLGNLVQDGVTRNLPAYLDADAFDKHMFVTGVTGSGKTTTCKNLLLAWDKPFLVIEPAKTEYRALKELCPDLIFFTPGKQEVAPFFLNPFELFPGEAITSRADMIKATLEAAFDMEAAIPQIMETAVYRAYTEKGWDIRTNEWLDENGERKDAFADGMYAFPTMSEFWQAVKKVTLEEGFGERLQDEYMGSLKARIESLLVGAKGMMLDNARSIDFNDLVTKKVVIELEEIKNGAEKSLLMGFILTNLLQAVQAHHREDPEGFRHITLVEEAHRLLSRYVPGDSMNKKQGVEVFADMLAEVRKYGESLIIVDQIPDKMTPEVLKNTNTKIVHKLFARDDKDTIGDTIALADEQKEFLSKLPTGRAVVFSQGWNKAVQVQMNEGQKQSGKEVTDDEIHDVAVQYYAAPHVLRRGVLRGLEHIKTPTAEKVEDYLWLMRGGHNALALCKKIFQAGEATEKDFAKLKRALIRLKTHTKADLWLTYLYWNCYAEENEERAPIFFDCMKQVAEKADAEPLCLQKNMDYLKFVMREDEDNS